MEILALLLLPLAWWFSSAVNKAHNDEHGVNMPSRTAMKNIRRAARKKGISEGAAHAQWVGRKQRKRF